MTQVFRCLLCFSFINNQWVSFNIDAMHGRNLEMVHSFMKLQQFFVSGNHTKQLDQIGIDPKFDSLPSQLLPKMCNSMVSLIQIV